LRVTIVHLRFEELLDDREQNTVKDGSDCGFVSGQQLRAEQQTLKVSDGSLTNIATTVDALLTDRKQDGQPESIPS
jgi:hypothetical protein